MKINEELPNICKKSKKIHNVRFYRIKPRSITCMAYNKIHNKLAFSRNDGSIEIWNLTYAPHPEKVISKSPNASVEGLAWAGMRLFSVGFYGALTEWDLQTLKVRSLRHLTGGALYCIDINREGTDLAVGTEEGYINILSIDDDEVLYKKLFDKQEGRVMCCKFNATGDFLVTGSQNAVRIWNVHRGHAIHKMRVQYEEKQNVMVWSVQVLKDFTIITGDSSGFVTVWDGNKGSQLQLFKVLEADVLTIAVDESEELLICSGIEPLIRIFGKTKIKRDDMEFDRWVKFLQRDVCKHDVKALACIDGRIFSGGRDGYLRISSLSKMKSSIIKYGPFLTGPIVTYSVEQNLILMRYPYTMELWRLGSVKPHEEIPESSELRQALVEYGKIRHLPLDSMPRKLLVIETVFNEFIYSAAISPNGLIIIYSTTKRFNMFFFDPEDPTKLEPYRNHKFDAASHILFSPDGSEMLLVNFKKKLYIYSTANFEFEVLQKVKLGHHIKTLLTQVKYSASGTYIAAVGQDNLICIWKRNEDEQFTHFINLPRYTAPLTALELHDNLPRLVAAFADGKIFEYDIEEMCFTCGSNDHHVENTSTHTIQNIVLDPNNPDVFIIQNDTYLYVLEKVKRKRTQSEDKEVQENVEKDSDPHEYNLRSGSPYKKSAKIAKPTPASDSDEEEKVCSLRLKKKINYEHLLQIARLTPDTLLTVGVSSDTLIDELPNSFKDKKFGKS